jgi:ribosomal protein L16
MKISKNNSSSGNRRLKGSNAKGLQTKLIKGNKSVKGRRINFKLYYKFGTDKTRSVERTHKIVLKALGNCRLSARHIETGRRMIKKFLSRKINLNVRVFPFSAVTKRPHDVRMGKGKGMRITDWIYPVKAGKVLYEVIPSYMSHSHITPSTAKHLFYFPIISVLKKLNLKFPVFVRPFLLEI